jgi:hypothetical protein
MKGHSEGKIGWCPDEMPTKRWDTVGEPTSHPKWHRVSRKKLSHIINFDRSRKFANNIRWYSLQKFPNKPFARSITILVR